MEENERNFNGRGAVNCRLLKMFLTMVSEFNAHGSKITLICVWNVFLFIVIKFKSFLDKQKLVFLINLIKILFFFFPFLCEGKNDSIK